MGCSYQKDCGGCTLRHLTSQAYRNYKIEKVQNILSTGLKGAHYVWDEPVFIADGNRRRAAFVFHFHQGKLKLGFNEARSSEIADCTVCPALTERLNAVLADLRPFLEKFCRVNTTPKIKGKHKPTVTPLSGGDILLLDAENGIDMVLEADIELQLDHRAEIFDFMNEHNAMIRFSHRRRPDGQAEPILEKTTPIITIGGYQVFVAPGMFLQASKAGEQALTETVLRYLGSDVGRVADLFCGIGTFTYPLARIGCQVEAYDVNESLLNGFRASVNAQMLHHVSIFKQNLFKYPPEPEELSRFDAVIFDPPRAGAAALVRQLAQVQGTKLRKVVAVSCNPHSFVNDARVLLESGYNLQNVTLVDQFVYSDHSELVALFTK